MLVNSFFTNAGVPATALTPTIRIWEITSGGDALVVTDDPMVEIGDGYYKYDYATYDKTKDYVIRTHGGASLPIDDQYQYGGNESFATDIANAVWEEAATDHLVAGTTGMLQNQIAADSACACTNATLALDIVNTLLKFESNRTRINKLTKTLTIYDDDGVTPLHVFDLKNAVGDPSTDEVCERDPQ